MAENLVPITRGDQKPERTEYSSVVYRKDCAQILAFFFYVFFFFFSNRGAMGWAKVAGLR